ncbi:MAG: ABC transporter substrate-binding protein [Bdellovibrio sp.]
MKNRILKIWSPRTPYSLDPLDYDALAHHIYFRSVYSSLVSDYRLGEINGVVASSWWSNPEKDSWYFQIRDNMFFSDGERIEAKDVALSLNRAAFLMKQGRSDSGLLENLKGIDELQAADQLASGIHYEKNIVTLEFKKPIPDILTKISFGLYGIVSSKNFDSKTGHWFNKKSIIGSGPYLVENWDDSEVKLRLRSDFPKNLLLTRPIAHAIYRHDAAAILKSDVVIDFDDSLAIDKSYAFWGPVKSAIRYIECEGWQKPDSICYGRCLIFS